MSVPSNEKPEGTGGGLLGPVNSVMSAIFDSVEAPEAEKPAEGGAPEGAPASPPAGGEPAAPAETPAEPAADGAETPAAGEPAAAGEAAPVRSAPPVVTVDDKVVVEQFGKMGEALEERFNSSFEQQAVAQAQEDYPHYIERLQMHPLELVGKELPAIDGSDESIVLRTPEEVAQWQEAVKTILQRELQASIAERQQESHEILDVVQASIQMFADNPDLVPGSKSYNKALASEFLRIAEPYALRMNGKLTGYSIPVQGLIDRVRAQVAARPAAAQTPAAKKAAAAPSKPQAGIASKAGAGGGKDEDYSPMWQALGINSAPI